MSSIFISEGFGLILLLFFLYYSYKNLKSWMTLTSESKKPYQQFFNISIFAFVACFIAFGLGIEQANYMRQPLEIYMVVFIPALILIGAIMIFLYFKLKGVKPWTAIPKFLFLFLGLLSLAEILFGIVCLIIALLTMLLGFGHMLDD